MKAANFKRLKVLEEENRGLRKRVKALTKAADRNYNGLLYWKKRNAKLEENLKVFNMWLSNTVH